MVKKPLVISIQDLPNIIGTEEFITINHSKQRGSGHILKFSYRDKDTRQMVSYIPSLDLSGYGESLMKADEMLQFNLKEFISYLLDLSPASLQAELSSLGWKHSVIKPKEYSKVYVDSNGHLQNFNAVGDELIVEEMTL